MKKIVSTLLTLSLFATGSRAQVFIIVYPLPPVPEHGFLPGKEFKFYPTVEKYDFGGRKIRVELYDDRDSLRLVQLECAKVEIDNQSEFVGARGAQAVQYYWAKLLPEADMVLDSTAADTVKVHLEALDSRMIGHFSIRAHGLCQMRIEHSGGIKTYCVDITDKDPHSPVSSHAFVTRLTATRIITSAAIREVIEQFFIDLKAPMPKPF
jgi:hypothetical protein